MGKKKKTLAHNKSLKKNRILLVDDQPLSREGMESLVKPCRDLEVCGEALTTTEGYKQVRALKPSLAILDISIEGDRGLEFIQRAKKHTKVMVLSLREETLYAERCLIAGALGYVSKREPTERILEGIRNVLAGTTFVGQRVTQRLLDRMVGHSSVDRANIEALTDRELEVFELLGQGATTTEVAKVLKISTKTVQAYCTNMRKSLQLANTNQLIRRAVHFVLEGQ